MWCYVASPRKATYSIYLAGMKDSSVEDESIISILGASKVQLWKSGSAGVYFHSKKQIETALGMNGKRIKGFVTVIAEEYKTKDQRIAEQGTTNVSVKPLLATGISGAFAPRNNTRDQETGAATVATAGTSKAEGRASSEKAACASTVQDRQEMGTPHQNRRDALNPPLISQESVKISASTKQPNTLIHSDDECAVLPDLTPVYEKRRPAATRRNESTKVDRTLRSARNNNRPNDSQGGDNDYEVAEMSRRLDASQTENAPAHPQRVGRWKDQPPGSE